MSYLFFFLILIGATLLQSTVIDFVLPFQIKPDLLLVLAVSAALCRGSLEGGVMGFFAGVFQEMASGLSGGISVLTKGICGAGSGLLVSYLFPDPFLVPFLTGASATLLHEFLFWVLATLTGKISLPFPLVSLVVPEMALNGLLTPVVFFLVRNSVFKDRSYTL